MTRTTKASASASEVSSTTPMQEKRRKRYQRLYRRYDGGESTWPHYMWGRYEIVDAGGYISLWFHRDQGDILGDDAVGFLPENLPMVIKMLQKAYRNKDWHLKPKLPLPPEMKRLAQNLKAGTLR